MKKLLLLLFVIAGLIITACESSVEELETQRIADSTKMSDSLAKVQAENQRIADSTVKAQAIADSITKTANLFGHKEHVGSQICRFRTSPSYISVDETRVWCAQKGGDLNEYLKTRTYSFYGENGKLYLISYADTLNFQNFPSFLHCGEKIERNLYLLRYDDGKWNIASNVIQTDYWKADDKITTEIIQSNTYSECIQSYSYTYLNRDDLKDLLYVKNGVSNGYVKKLDNGNIEIRLLIFISDNGHDEDYSWKTWRFTPNNDGTYDIWQHYSK